MVRETWVCHFCFGELPAGEAVRAGWDLVYQCAVCPACLRRANEALPMRWAAELPAGAYADGQRDPGEAGDGAAPPRGEG